jgi:hypothetical protein
MREKSAAVPTHWPLMMPLQDLWISESPACCFTDGDTRTFVIPDVTRETTIKAIADVVSSTYKCGDVRLEFITYDGTTVQYERLDPSSTAEDNDLFNRVYADRLVVTLSGLSDLARQRRLQSSGPSRSAPVHRASSHLPVVNAFLNKTLQCPLLDDIKGSSISKLRRHNNKANQRPCEVSRMMMMMIMVLPPPHCSSSYS